MPNSKTKALGEVQTYSGPVAVEPAPIKAKEQDGRYPDGTPSRISPTECVRRPNGCRCKKAGTYGPDKVDRFECADCGFTTLNVDEARSRNPALRS